MSEPELAQVIDITTPLSVDMKRWRKRVWSAQRAGNLIVTSDTVRHLSRVSEDNKRALAEYIPWLEDWQAREALRASLPTGAGKVFVHRYTDLVQSGGLSNLSLPGRIFEQQLCWDEHVLELWCSDGVLDDLHTQAQQLKTTTYALAHAVANSAGTNYDELLIQFGLEDTASAHWAHEAERHLRLVQ